MFPISYRQFHRLMMSMGYVRFQKLLNTYKYNDVEYPSQPLTDFTRIWMFERLQSLIMFMERHITEHNKYSRILEAHDMDVPMDEIQITIPDDGNAYRTEQDPTSPSYLLSTLMLNIRNAVEFGALHVLPVCTLTSLSRSACDQH